MHSSTTAASRGLRAQTRGGGHHIAPGLLAVEFEPVLGDDPRVVAVLVQPLDEQPLVPVAAEVMRRQARLREAEHADGRVHAMAGAQRRQQGDEEDSPEHSRLSLQSAAEGA